MTVVRHDHPPRDRPAHRMIPALAVTVWVVAVMLALRTNHRLNTTPQPAPADDLPAWVWTQDRVDAQFRAITAPLTR